MSFSYVKLLFFSNPGANLLMRFKSLLQLHYHIVVGLIKNFISGYHLMRLVDLNLLDLQSIQHKSIMQAV